MAKTGPRCLSGYRAHRDGLGVHAAATVVSASSSGAHDASNDRFSYGYEQIIGNRHEHMHDEEHKTGIAAGGTLSSRTVGSSHWPQRPYRQTPLGRGYG